MLKFTTVSLRALAPLTKPPVVPEILLPMFGFRKRLIASISIDPAVTLAELPTNALTGVLALLSTRAPAPAKSPPLVASTFPFVSEVELALILKSPERSIDAFCPILDVVSPVCVVRADADAPAATPPLPASVSERVSIFRTALTVSEPPECETEFPTLAVTVTSASMLAELTPAARIPNATLLASL